jgi:hypothetical protein
MYWLTGKRKVQQEPQRKLRRLKWYRSPNKPLDKIFPFATGGINALLLVVIEPTVAAPIV